MGGGGEAGQAVHSDSEISVTAEPVLLIGPLILQPQIALGRMEPLMGVGEVARWRRI